VVSLTTHLLQSLQLQVEVLFEMTVRFFLHNPHSKRLLT
jgi:hypothetical protein